MNAIDWSTHEQFPISTTVHCRCGAVYRSHAKATRVEGRVVVRSQLPCPGCNRDDDVWRVQGDPEKQTL